MALLTSFRHTCALPATWLGLRSLCRLSSTSSTLRAALDDADHVWSNAASRLRPLRAWGATRRALVGANRRDAGGRLLRLTAAERRRVDALPLGVVVRALAHRQNAPLVAHEAATTGDAGGRASSYPPSICRGCGRFKRSLVWGARCARCYDRDGDLEIDARACNALGLRAQHRRGADYRTASGLWGAQFKYYDVRRLCAWLRAAVPPRHRNTRRAITIRAAARRGFEGFRQHVCFAAS